MKLRKLTSREGVDISWAASELLSLLLGCFGLNLIAISKSQKLRPICQLQACFSLVAAHCCSHGFQSESSSVRFPPIADIRP